MAENPAQTRRRFQFSLRTLFVVTTILAVAAWIIRVAGSTSIPFVLLALWWLNDIAKQFRKVSPEDPQLTTGIRWGRVFFWSLASMVMVFWGSILVLVIVVVLKHR